MHYLFFKNIKIMQIYSVPQQTHLRNFPFFNEHFRDQFSLMELLQWIPRELKPQA